MTFFLCSHQLLFIDIWYTLPTLHSISYHALLPSFLPFFLLSFLASFLSSLLLSFLHYFNRFFRTINNYLSCFAAIWFITYFPVRHITFPLNMLFPSIRKLCQELFIFCCLLFFLSSLFLLPLYFVSTLILIIDKNRPVFSSKNADRAKITASVQMVDPAAGRVVMIAPDVGLRSVCHPICLSNWNLLFFLIFELSISLHDLYFLLF